MCLTVRNLVGRHKFTSALEQRKKGELPNACRCGQYGEFRDAARTAGEARNQELLGASERLPLRDRTDPLHRQRSGR